MGDGCPGTEIALMAARAGRPRKTDCDPSTDFNLCAFEREYSIEAARLPDVWASACRALRADVLVAGSVQLRDAGASPPARQRSALDSGATSYSATTGVAAETNGVLLLAVSQFG